MILECLAAKGVLTVHTIMSLGLRFAFVCAISIVFTVFIVNHPGVQKKWTRSRWVGVLFIGVVIGAVFLVSSTLYVNPD
jgi:hypothetical protein